MKSSSRGFLFANIVNTENVCKKKDWMDESKVLLLYMQLHNLALKRRQEYGNDEKLICYTLVDDKGSLLSDLFNFIQNHKKLFPRNVSIVFRQYNGQNGLSRSVKINDQEGCEPDECYYSKIQDPDIVKFVYEQYFAEEYLDGLYNRLKVKRDKELEVKRNKELDLDYQEVYPKISRFFDRNSIMSRFLIFIWNIFFEEELSLSTPAIAPESIPSTSASVPPSSPPTQSSASRGEKFEFKYKDRSYTCTLPNGIEPSTAGEVKGNLDAIVECIGDDCRDGVLNLAVGGENKIQYNLQTHALVIEGVAAIA